MPRPPKSTSLEARIQDLAGTFAKEVIGALRAVSLSDIAALSGASATTAVTRAPAANGHAERPKRVITNFPKCQWPGCGKNRSPRTAPYCGEHWREAKMEQEMIAAQDKAAEEKAAANKGGVRKTGRKRG